MRYLFTEAPLFVPTMDMSRFQPGTDLERRVEEKLKASEVETVPEQKV
jgi:hypothetical protein